jgi:hypothetical protein
MMFTDRTPRLSHKGRHGADPLPEDLLLKSHFLDDNRYVVERLATLYD